jgi:hypothetical protein
MNKEALQKWALGSEIVGAVAVVATLVFLIIETRENTETIRSQTYLQLTAELNEQRRYLVNDEINALMYVVLTDGIDALEAPDQFRVINLWQATWAVYESGFYSFQRGTLGEDEWHRYLIAICRTKFALPTLWEREEGASISGSITPAFKQYVDSSCRQ